MKVWGKFLGKSLPQKFDEKYHKKQASISD